MIILTKKNHAGKSLRVQEIIRGLSQIYGPLGRRIGTVPGISHTYTSTTTWTAVPIRPDWNSFVSIQVRKKSACKVS